MAQVSDVSLANQGFSAFRTELNNILSALNTGNFQCSGDDHDCIVGYYKNNSVPNLANTVTFNSTNYSSITYDNSI